ncbi:MAG: hypothetical protein E6J56_25560 [Deltaproteobacteria bacterium]|nr:MAG: hypothetical protein E6J56_25560 [Deltaproteobacteria bacterium]
MPRWEIAAVLALMNVAAGCSHYHGAYELDSGLRQQVRGDLAVAGVLDRRSGEESTVPCARGTAALARRAGAPDVSGRLDASEVALLLSGPAQLSLNAPQLAALRDRLGHRYVVVGEEGREPVTHVLFWDVFVVVPTPWVIVWWNFPVPVSRRNAVPHATRILRVVDLGTATVVGESYELLRDRPDGGEFSDGEVRGGLSAMSLN